MNISDLLPFVPAKYRAIVIALLAASPAIGRALYALMNGRGIKGTLAAIWCGTNTPQTNSVLPNSGKTTPNKRP